MIKISCRQTLMFRAIILFICAPVWAADGTATPIRDRPPRLYVVQFAGNIGLVSAGFGVTLNNNAYFCGLMYGYLPESVNGSEVHALSVKNGVRLCSLKLMDDINAALYAGLAINWYITNNTYLKYPAHYPDDYYDNNAIKSAPFISLNVGSKSKSRSGSKPRIGFYCELGTMSHYLYNVIIKKGHYSMEMWNLALGLSLTSD